MKRIEVTIDETNIPAGAIQIAQALPGRRDLDGGDTNVVLRFSGRFIFHTGLVLLAAWRKSLPQNVRVSIDDRACPENAKRLLDNTGFREIVESNAEQPSTIIRSSGRVPLRPIIRGYSTEAAIADACRVFDEFTLPGSDIKPFRMMLSELCENTFVHSEFQTPGYLCAHFHQMITPPRYEIAIADSGIGISNSFLEGTNTEAKNRIKGGGSAIQIALEGLFSSKPSQV